MIGMQTVEQYLSAIDIALLETPEPIIDSIEGLLAFLGAKDEKEALGAMYQALSLVEVYINRIIQHVLITFYNANKAYGDKSVSPFLESQFALINELTQEYQQLILNANKKAIDPAVVTKTNESIKMLTIENDKLKKECAELIKKLEIADEPQSIILFPTEVPIKDINENTTELHKLEKLVEDMNAKLTKANEAQEKSLITISQNEIEIKSLTKEIEEIKALKSMY